MKDIIIGDTQYSGVSKIKLNTVGGSTAQFQDVEELGTPTGSISIAANGSYDVEKYARAVVAVPTEGGNGMESGSIAGSETNTLEIPVSSAKSHIVVWTNIAGAIALATPYTNMHVTAVQGEGLYYSMTNVSGAATLGYAVGEDEYTLTDGSGKNVSCEFGADKVVIVLSEYNKLQKWAASMTYDWVAW